MRTSLSPAALLWLAGLIACTSQPSDPESGLPPGFSGASLELPFQGGEHPGLGHAVWYDGRAEVARYRATRSIYGLERSYTATLYTNVQRMDPTTSTKSVDGKGVEVFKHHRSERIPTENYDYDFSTAVFLERPSLRPFKQTFASQEDCGASFKQLWREGRDLRWLESTYFPGGGMRELRLDGRSVPNSIDALPLLLRALPANAPVGTRYELQLVDTWRDARSSPLALAEYTVEVGETATREVPAGRFECREVRVTALASGIERRYAFATDAEPPLLGVLVAYDGPGSESLRLSSVERDAYWERD